MEHHFYFKSIYFYRTFIYKTMFKQKLIKLKLFIKGKFHITLWINPEVTIIWKDRLLLDNYYTIWACVIISYRTIGNTLLCFRYPSSATSLTRLTQENWEKLNCIWMCEHVYYVSMEKMFCTSMSYIKIYYTRLDCTNLNNKNAQKIRKESLNKQ